MAAERPLYTVDDLPGETSPESWKSYRKLTLTKAIRIDGPFDVITVHSGRVTCDDGWLAVDAHGFPYPIAADEFEAIYEEYGGEPDD